MNFDMKKITSAAVISAAVVAGTFATSTPAQATHKIGHAILGGVIGGVIGGAIVNGVNRRPVYQAPPPVYAAPAPVYRGLPQAHYNYCWNKYRSYHQDSNTFQPWGNYPRRQCRSPWWR